MAPRMRFASYRASSTRDPRRARRLLRGAARLGSPRRRGRLGGAARSGDGDRSGHTLAFHEDVEYVPPVWPSVLASSRWSPTSRSRPTTSSAPSPTRWRVAPVLADFQPQADVRVMLDPDGHPFCLFPGPARDELSRPDAVDDRVVEELDHPLLPLGGGHLDPVGVAGALDHPHLDVAVGDPQRCTRRRPARPPPRTRRSAGRVAVRRRRPPPPGSPGAVHRSAGRSARTGDVDPALHAAAPPVHVGQPGLVAPRPRVAPSATTAAMRASAPMRRSPPRRPSTCRPRRSAPGRHRAAARGTRRRRRCRARRTNRSPSRARRSRRAHTRRSAAPRTRAGPAPTAWSSTLADVDAPRRAAGPRPRR